MSETTSYPYETRLNIHCQQGEVIDQRPLADACAYKWYNQTLCQVNESVVRLGVVQGEYRGHKPDDDDESFYLVEGKLLIDLPDRTVELAPRQGFVVSTGVIHRTCAEERTVTESNRGQFSAGCVTNTAWKRRPLSGRYSFRGAQEEI